LTKGGGESSRKPLTFGDGEKSGTRTKKFRKVTHDGGKGKVSPYTGQEKRGRGKNYKPMGKKRKKMGGGRLP